MMWGGLPPILTAAQVQLYQRQFASPWGDVARALLFGILSMTADQLCERINREREYFRSLLERDFTTHLRNIDAAKWVIEAATTRMQTCDIGPESHTYLQRDNGVLRGIGRLWPLRFGPVASEMTLRRYNRKSRLFGSSALNDALHVLSLSRDDLEKLSRNRANWFRNLRCILGYCYPSTISTERAPLACVVERIKFCDRSLVNLRIAGLVADGEAIAANAPVFSAAKTPDWRARRHDNGERSAAVLIKPQKRVRTLRTMAMTSAQCGL